MQSLPTRGRPHLSPCGGRVSAKQRSKQEGVTILICRFVKIRDA